MPQKNIQTTQATEISSSNESDDPPYSPSQTLSDESGSKSPIEGRTRSKKSIDEVKIFKASEQIKPNLDLDESGKVIVLGLAVDLQALQAPKGRLYIQLLMLLLNQW